MNKKTLKTIVYALLLLLAADFFIGYWFYNKYYRYAKSVDEYLKRENIAVVKTPKLKLNKKTIYFRKHYENIEHTALSDRFVSFDDKKNNKKYFTQDDNMGSWDISGWKDIEKIYASGIAVFGLKADGTVVAAGKNNRGQLDINDWTDITDMAVSGGHTIGIKTDGTVIAAGSKGFGKCDVQDWQDIKKVSVSNFHTVGLTNDGTVVATGNNGYGQCNVGDWQDIIDIAAGSKGMNNTDIMDVLDELRLAHTIGLKADGTVVAVGSNTYGQCNVGGWQDITAIAAGNFHTVGLKSDGTVVATGDNTYGQCDVYAWKDVVKIFASDTITVGLKNDGTILYAGLDKLIEEEQAKINKTEQASKETKKSETNNAKKFELKVKNYNSSDWKDITDVSVSNGHIIGLKNDGTVVSAGDNTYGRCDVAGWKDISAVYTGSQYTVGLKNDGTAVVTTAE